MKTLHQYMIGIAVAAMLGVAATQASAQQKAKDSPPKLFTLLGGAAPREFQPRRGTQFELIQIDTALLGSLRSQSRFTMTVPGALTLPARVDRVEIRGESQLSVFGGLEGDDTGWFILVLENDAVAGMIHSPAMGLLYEVRFVEAGTHAVVELDDSLFPECGIDGGAAPKGGGAPKGAAPAEQESGIEEEEPEDAEGAAPRGTCNPPGTVFDTLIVYSDDARAAAGGTDAINALCQLSIDVTNQTYTNSVINARMRLVFRSEVAYDESGTAQDHLNRLISTSDGVLDFVHGWRDTYRADMVCLLVDDDDPDAMGNGTICGLAQCNSNAANAFSIVIWDCATGNFSFPHELGHNQGADHDAANVGSGCNYSNYDRGWLFTGNDMANYRTVMAYDDPAPGTQFTRIGYFSNPNVTFQGVVTGVAVGQPNEAFNVQVINNRAGTVEGFRQTVFDVWVDFGNFGGENGSFGQPFNTVAEGVGAIPLNAPAGGASELPTLWIKEGSTSETATINRPMIIRSCGGTASIGL